jgi:hypothetical protein
LEIDHYKETPMRELPDGTYMLCRMLPPEREIRYYFSMTFKDEVKVYDQEQEFILGLMSEI